MSRREDSSDSLASQLSQTTMTKTPYAIIDYPDDYVQPLVVAVVQKQIPAVKRIPSLAELPATSTPVLQFTAYESLDFEHAMQNPTSSLLCAYVIRKALIRKHYLSNTVSTWLVKHPSSILAQHFKPSVHFELDYAEFLDEALIDAWDLNESMAANRAKASGEQKQWWILKPGMSDGGNGIRLFSSIAELQAIFEEWEIDEPDSEPDTSDDIDPEQQQQADRPDEADGVGAMTSQLRHFVAQPYIDPPLLLSQYGNRKFHLRVYVLAVGALRVYVSRELLALFAAKEYHSPSNGTVPDTIELAQHLTNTCFQDETTKSSSVHRFWDLHSSEMQEGWKDDIFQQICNVTGEIFEAAAREQMVHFQVIPNAFEIFGVDFLVDVACNVWLLELNAYPDFKQTGSDLQDMVVGGLFEEVAKTAIAPFFGGLEHLSERLPLVRSVDLGRR
jgi:tubulin---tyrosine ligase